MSNVASERVVNGIKTRVLHGKDYVEVAERVRIVQHDDTAQGFSMIKQERYEWNDRHFVSITIEVKGKLYIGDAEVTFSAPKNTPAGTSPLETAQTSALGRALAFAGYGTVESIASFDEVYRAISIEESGRPVVEAARSLEAPKVSQNPKPETSAPAPDDSGVPTVKELQERCAALFGVGYWQAMVLKALNREEPIRERDLLVEQRVEIAKFLDRQEKAKALRAGKQPAA
jgi:hypothetical protein